VYEVFFDTKHSSTRNILRLANRLRFVYSTFDLRMHEGVRRNN